MFEQESEPDLQMDQSTSFTLSGSASARHFRKSGPARISHSGVLLSSRKGTKRAEKQEKVKGSQRSRPAGLEISHDTLA